MTEQIVYARVLGLPDHIPMTRSLSMHIDRLAGGRDTFLRDGRRLFDWFNPWPAQGPTAKELIDFYLFRNDGPGRTLSLIANCDAIMRELGIAPPPSLVINDLNKRLVKFRKDGRVVAVAIGEVEGSTFISMDELVPNPDHSLESAIHYLAILVMTRWQSRPEAALQVPMRSIRRFSEGYFATATMTKTFARPLAIDDDLVAASNRVASMLPPSAKRHILGDGPGTHSDALLEKAVGKFIPALNSQGQFRGHDAHFERHWYGRMLKRRVDAVCSARGLSREQHIAILARTSGKSSRRGGKADDVFNNTSLQESMTNAFLETPHLALLYGDGGRDDTSPIVKFVLSQPALAFVRAKS